MTWPMRVRPPAIALVLLLVCASISGCVTDDGKNEPPEADAGPDAEAEVGEDVVFQGTGVDEDGSVVAFRWDFDGDGTWDYEGEVGARIHVYTIPGSYQAALQVEDEKGATASDSRWVNVTASVRVIVDWANGTGFRVRVSERLSVEDIVVDWTMYVGGPTPITRTFTNDAGLSPIDATTLAFDPNVASIEAGQRHVVEVRLRDLVLASRTIDVVDLSDAEGAYTAVYYGSLSDYRERGQNWTDLWREGNHTVEKGTGWVREHFSGQGVEGSYSNVSGVITSQMLNLTNVSVETGSGGDWGEAWWRYQGHGSVEQWSDTGLYVFAFVSDLDRTVENGSLTTDDWTRIGRYSGQNDTNGTFELVRETEGNMIFVNGEGVQYEVLRVRSEKDFEGTNLGRDFILHNVSTDYDASRLFFENRTIYREALQQVGFQTVGEDMSWQNTSWTGYLDTNGDGTYNPDPLSYDPILASSFTGARPRLLDIGDTFTGTNFYGKSLRYEAKRDDNSTLRIPGNELEVRGVLAEAMSNTTSGSVLHWFWVLEDGPLPGLVFEERVRVTTPGFGGGTYDWYRNMDFLLSY